MLTRKPIISFMLQKPDPLATLYNAGIHRGGRWLVCGVSLVSLRLLPGFSFRRLSTPSIRQDAQANSRTEHGYE
jgi:hypothetical protein